MNQYSNSQLSADSNVTSRHESTQRKKGTNDQENIPRNIHRKTSRLFSESLLQKSPCCFRPFTAGSPSISSAWGPQEPRLPVTATPLPLHSLILCLPSSDSIKPLSTVSVWTANSFKAICICPHPQFTFICTRTEKGLGWERTIPKTLPNREGQILLLVHLVQCFLLCISYQRKTPVKQKLVHNLHSSRCRHPYRYPSCEPLCTKKHRQERL